MTKHSILLTGVHPDTALFEVQDQYPGSKTQLVGENEKGKLRFRVSFKTAAQVENALKNPPLFHQVRATVSRYGGKNKETKETVNPFQKVETAEQKTETMTTTTTTKTKKVQAAQEAIEVTFPDTVCLKYYFEKGGAAELKQIAAKMNLALQVSENAVFAIGPVAVVERFKNWLEQVHKTMYLNFYVPINLKTKLEGTCRTKKVAYEFKASSANPDQVLVFLYGKQGEVAFIETEFAIYNQPILTSKDPIEEEPEEDITEQETREESEATSIVSEATSLQSVPNLVKEQVQLNFMAKAKPILVLQARKTWKQFPQAKVYIVCKQKHAFVNFYAPLKDVAAVKAYFFSIAEKRLTLQMNKAEFAQVKDSELQNIQYQYQCKIEKNTPAQKLIFVAQPANLQQAVTIVSNKYCAEQTLVIPVSHSRAVFLVAVFTSAQLCAQYNLPSVSDAKAVNGLTIKCKPSLVATLKQKIETGLGIVEKEIDATVPDLKLAKFVVRWLTSHYGESSVNENAVCVFVKESQGLTKKVTIVASSEELLDKYEEFVLYFAANACSFMYDTSKFSLVHWAEIENAKKQFESTICEFVRNDPLKKLFINAYNSETMQLAKKLVEEILQYGATKTTKIVVLEPLIFSLLLSEWKQLLVQTAATEKVSLDCSQTRDHRLVVGGASSAVAKVVLAINNYAGIIEQQLKYDSFLVTPAAHKALIGKYHKKIALLQNETSTSILMSKKKQNITILSGTFKNLTFKLIFGDIVQSQCSALVNPALKTLSTHNGLAKAYASRAGKEFENECAKIKDSGPLAVGKAVFTCAGDISPSKIIIHAIVPSFKKNNTAKINKLGDAVRNCLLVAESKEMDSIAFPLLTNDVSNTFPVAACISTITKTIIKHFQTCKQSSISKIHFYTDKKSVAQEWVSNLSDNLESIHANKFDPEWLDMMGTKQPTTTVTTPQSVQPEYEWFWMDDDAMFKPYSFADNAVIETAFAANRSAAQLNITRKKDEALTSYVIYFANPQICMVTKQICEVFQYHPGTGYVRSVTRRQKQPRQVQVINDTMVPIYIRGKQANINSCKTKLGEFVNSLAK